MITVRQIQKLWAAKDAGRLTQQLLQPRVEGGTRLAKELSQPAAAAALSVIRLDEMSQSYVPLAAELLRVVIAAQKPDGGWGEPITTALCIRALIASRGHGAAVENGIRFLANLQKEDGLWPNAAVRRLPSDPFASAYVLLQLGDYEPFRAAVQFDAAFEWFGHNEPALDDDARRLWAVCRRRCQSVTPATMGGFWS